MFEPSPREYQRLKEDLEDLKLYIEEFSAFLPLAVGVINPVGIIININEAFEKLTGFKTIEIVGQSLETIFSEKEEIEEIVEKMPQKERVKEKEFTLLPKNKEKIPVNIYFSARKDKQGNFIGCFVALVDITESKKLREQLEQKVEERTRELKQKLRELKKLWKIAEGRELRMVELKEEIKRLKQEIKKLKEKIKGRENKN